MVSEPLETIIELTIPADFAGIRLDQALARLLPDWSRSRLQTWIREKRISVDGAAAIPKQKVWSGEKIEVRPSSHPVETMHAPEPFRSILFTKMMRSLSSINLQGWWSIPGSGNWQGTMLNALLHHAANSIRVTACWYRSSAGQGYQRAAGSSENARSPDPAWCGNCKNTPSTAIIWRSSWAGFRREDRSMPQWDDIRFSAPKWLLLAGGKRRAPIIRCWKSSDGCTLLGAVWKLAARIRFACTCTRLVIRFWETQYMGANRKGTFRTPTRLTGFCRQALHAQRLELTHPQHGSENGVGSAVTRRYEQPPAGARAEE